MIFLLQEPESTVWIANWVTSSVLGVAIAIIGFSLKRYISQQDNRHDDMCEKQGALSKKVEDCDERSNEIVNNYVKKFEQVNREINDSNHRLGQQLTHEIREITKDKNLADIAQVKEMAEVKGEVKGLKEKVEQVLRVLK